MRRSANPENTAILAVTIRARDTSDDERLKKALGEIAKEDPSLKIDIGNSSDESVLAGMIGGTSESQLEKVCAVLIDRYALKCNVSEPIILYLEAIRKSAEAEGKYIRQTGGSGNYGHCWLRVEPNEPGKGYEFINDIKGGVVPKEYIKPIDQGIQGALELGILAGFPIVDVKVTLFDGSYHDVDSNEMAFKFAGSIAFKEAARKASPVLLEPVMAVEVTVPEERMGTVIADINSRRGRIEGMENAAGLQVIKAIVPLRELLSTSPGVDLTSNAVRRLRTSAGWKMDGW